MQQALATNPPPPRVGKLATLRQCRIEAARLYRAARRGEVAAGDASKLASVLALIAALLRDGDLEARITRLETDRGP